VLFKLFLESLPSRDFSFLIYFFFADTLFTLLLFSSLEEVNNFIFLVSDISINLLLFLLKTFISPPPTIFTLFILSILLFFVVSYFLSLLLDINFWGTIIVCMELSSEFLLFLIFPNFDSSLVLLPYFNSI
jgi:hypothetical protein